MSTEKEELEDQIQRHQISIVECQRKLKSLEKKKWTLSDGELVEIWGEVFTYGRQFWSIKHLVTPYFPDINQLMIKRDPEDQERPDWDGLVLVRNRYGHMWSNLVHRDDWRQRGAEMDIVAWLPIGDDYAKVRKAWLNAKGI